MIFDPMVGLSYEMKGAGEVRRRYSESQQDGKKKRKSTST